MVQENIDAQERRKRRRPRTGHPHLEPIVVLLGATATGKSSLAVSLATGLPLEIVNCDASQFYVGLDIGTAKPGRRERTLVPHHLYDIAPPESPLNAGEYVRLADRQAGEILDREGVPLFVGGTGLYIRALTLGLAEIPDVSEQVRNKVSSMLEGLGGRALHEELLRVDPATGVRVSANDPQRLTRALEVYYETGKPISYFQKQHRFRTPRYDALKVGLEIPREELNRRIVKRVRGMFEEGFAEEVRRLLAVGHDFEARAFKALGYREVAAHVQGEISEREAMERVCALHRRYAKRQRTWFRKESGVHWFTPADEGRITALVGEFCQRHLP